MNTLLCTRMKFINLFFFCLSVYPIFWNWTHKSIPDWQHSACFQKLTTNDTVYHSIIFMRRREQQSKYRQSGQGWWVVGIHCVHSSLHRAEGLYSWVRCRGYVYERFLKQKLIRVTLATEAGLYFTREGPSSIYTYSMHDTSSLYVLGDSRELSPLNSGKLHVRCNFR